MNQGQKTAVVTGATHGIGRAIAERFLAEGFAVAVCARNDRELHALAESWRREFSQATIVAEPADFSNKEDVLRFAELIEQTFPRTDVLINNAGIFFPGSIADEDDGNLEKLMAVNLYSVYHLTRALLPGMKEARSGHIVNLCSVASLKAYPGGGSYSITKYALLGFSDNLREELKPHGVRVTAVCPGATWSRSWSGSGVEEERTMAAEDVAEVVWAAHALSPRADLETIVMRPQLGDL